MPATSIDFARIEAVLRQASAAAAQHTLPLFRTPLAIDNKLDAGFDPRVIVGDRAFGLAKIPGRDKEGDERRNTLLKLCAVLGEILFDLPQQPE